MSLIAPSVRQGSLEHSNTDLAGAMTELITLQRSLQLASRALVPAGPDARRLERPSGGSGDEDLR